MDCCTYAVYCYCRLICGLAILQYSEWRATTLFATMEAISFLSVEIYPQSPILPMLMLMAVQTVLWREAVRERTSYYQYSDVR